jgi:hypothetical protein
LQNRNVINFVIAELVRTQIRRTAVQKLQEDLHYFIKRAQSIMNELRENSTVFRLILVELFRKKAMANTP